MVYESVKLLIAVWVLFHRKIFQRMIETSLKLKHYSDSTTLTKYVQENRENPEMELERKK